MFILHPELFDVQAFYQSKLLSAYTRQLGGMSNAADHLKKACFQPHLLQAYYANLEKTIAYNMSVLEKFYLNLPITLVEEESIKHSVSDIVSLLTQLAYHLKLLNFESGRVESVSRDFQKKCDARHRMASTGRKCIPDLAKTDESIASLPQSTSTSQSHCSSSPQSTRISELSLAIRRNSPKHRPNHSIVIKVILRRWYGLNAHHPYPNESAKTELCFQTGLTEKQLNTWFVNFRRRSGFKKADKSEEDCVGRREE